MSFIVLPGEIVDDQEAVCFRVTTPFSSLARYVYLLVCLKAVFWVSYTVENELVKFVPFMDAFE